VTQKWKDLLGMLPLKLPSPDPLPLRWSYWPAEKVIQGPRPSPSATAKSIPAWGRMVAGLADAATSLQIEMIAVSKWSTNRAGRR
jgi:hypothetical protein